MNPGGRRPRTRLLGAPLLVALLSLVLVSTASAPVLATTGPSPSPSADKSPTAGEAGRVGFGVVPATADGLDVRALFSFGLTPSSVAYDHVALVNYSTSKLRLDVYATDALNAEQGGYALRTAAERPVDLGAWVVVRDRHGHKASRITVPGRRKDGSPGRVILPVEISIPDNATPGDHSAGIVAALTTVGKNPKGQNIQLEQRVASRVYVRVDGPLTPSLTVSDIKATFVKPSRPWQSGSVDVTYTVSNSGNLRMGFQPSVTVAGPAGLGKRSVASEPVAELLPGNSQKVRSTVTGVWPLARLNVTADVTPVAAVAAEAPELGVVSQSTSIWALTWETVLALLLLLASVTYIVVRKIRRRRQNRSGPAPSAPAEARVIDLRVPVPARGAAPPATRVRRSFTLTSRSGRVGPTP